MAKLNFDQLKRRLDRMPPNKSAGGEQPTSGAEDNKPGDPTD